MKRSYTYLKGLLTLALAAFTGWMWAAGESISIGVNNGYDGPAYSGDTLYGWTNAQVAGKNWNNYNNESSLSELKGNDGIVVSGASFEVTAKGGSWKHYGPSELGGGTRDYYDGQWKFALKGIPFSQYSVVLFMATDNGGKKWGAVKVTAGTDEKFYTYTNGALSAEGTADSTWGDTSLASNYTAEEGVNVMVIPNLSGNTTFVTYGTSGGAATRGGLYAIQIINTGDLIDSTTYEASSAATSVKFSELTWDKEFKPTAVDSAVLTLTATEAVTLEIDQNLALANLVVNAAGDVTITSSGKLSLSTLDCRNVKGKLTIPATIASATGLMTATTEGASTYVTGETTVATQQLPYSGNRHFENIRFTVAQVGAGIANYTVAENETMLFTTNDINYIPTLIVDGGSIKTTGSGHAWFGGEADTGLTINSGVADFSSVTSDNGSAAVLIGYSGNGHKFDIQGGLLDASNTSIVGWEQNSKYQQSGGLVKTKGFRQNGSRFTEMTLTGGTIELGAGGIPDLGMASATLGAATIRATADATIAEALNVTGAATLQAVDGKILTVSGAISGEGTIAIGGTATTKTRADDGTYSDATVNATGTVYIGTNRPKIASIAEGATLQITLTDAELENGISWTVGENLTTEEARRLTVVGAELDNITVTDGTLTATLASSLAASWENGVWSKTPVTGSPVTITFSEGNTTCTFTNTEAIELASLTIKGETAGEIVLGEYAVTVSEMTVEPAEVTIPVALFNSFDAQAYTVESGKTLKLKGDADVSKTMAVSGTLALVGDMNFTSSNVVYNGGTLDVLSGVSTFNTNGGGNGFQNGSTIKIASSATLKSGVSDAPGYGSVTFDIAGTLEATDTARWSLGNTASITLREGAVLNGSGGAGGYNYAYDCFGGATIDVLGDATINGNIGAHNGGTITFDIADGKTVTLKGKYDGGVYGGAPKLAVTGSGTLVLANENTYTGGTSIANGSKLVVTHASALGSGGITLDGALTFKDVEIELNNANAITQTDPENTTNPTGQIVIDNSTVTLNAPNGNYKGAITVNTGATLKSVTNNYAPFGNGSSIVNNGAIVVENSGDCAIAASMSGAGSLTVTSGNLSLFGANTYKGATTIAEGATVNAQTESGATWNFNNVTAEPDVTVNGTLNFVSTSELYRGFAGTGTINIKGNVTLGNTGNTNEVSGLSRFTGNLVVDAEKTLTLITWGNPYNIVVESLTLNGAIAGQAKGGNASTLSLTTQSLSGTGTINVPVTFADGATLNGAVTVNANVTVDGTITITHADEAGDTVLTCANADAVAAALTGAPAGLKYVAEEGAVKLAVAKVTVTLPAVPNAVWKDANGDTITSITLDPNSSASVKLETTGDYVFADGSTSMDVTIASGDADSEATAPADASIVAAGAKIGDKLYTSFAAAFAAAQADETITLLAGVTINSRLDIAQNVTIDLNGKTIAETVEDTFGAIYVKKGATLTIAATNGGEITTDGGIVIGNYGTVIVNGGTIAAGEEPEADVSIYNFYYQADWYGTTTINGGSVARIWNCGIATLAGGEVTDVDNSGAMTITDAEVTNVILRDGTDAPGIEGAGTLKAAEDLTVTTEEGYKAVYDAETGTWTAIDPSVGKAAKIGDEYYTTLADALTAAEADDTITLLADATITERTTIDKNITIDLNGNTIAETVEDQFGAIYVKKGATLMIAATNGGEITTDGGIVIGNYGTVIVNGGTIAAGDEPEADVSIYNFYYQADWYGTTTINGGTVARIWNCGIATLAGGEVTDVDNSGAMTITDAEVTNVILRDGTDAPGIEGAGTLKAAEDLTVTTEEGYKAVYDSTTGTWTAIDPSIGKAAKIGDEYYDTFLGENGALAKAKAGDTITLLAGLTASEIITIEKAITIDGNNQTLTSTAGRAINVDCAGAVTIKNLTINAGERAINIINQAATVTINGVKATAKNVAVMIATTAGAAQVAIADSELTGLMVVGVYGADADVTIDGSTITNVDANKSENYGAITVGDTADKATVAVTNTTITVADDSKKAYNFSSTATITGVDQVGVVVAMIGEAGYDTIEEAAGDVKAGQTIVLVTDVSTTTPLAIAGTLDLNGKTLTADIAGTIKMNGGTFATTDHVMVGANGKYSSTDAVFTIAANATYDMTVTAGTLTLNENPWYTLEGQTITIGENAAIEIPAGKILVINGSTIVVNGTATVAGEVQLFTKTSTVKAPAGLNVTTTVAGCEVKYVEGVYTVVESIVIEDVIAATPAAEAIKAAMEAAGVTEIETYIITTKGADAAADADAVAAVLEVFDVTPIVDEDGELTVAYEFGISAMTNVGEVITITAGVTGAEYRAGVEVAFYADGEEIGTATTTADSTEVSITNIQAATINGKKITVKATK